MALSLKPSTSEERTAVILETLLSKTSKVSKVSDNSVLRAIAAGVSKVTGKAEKDIILAVSKLFPDNAFGLQLDQLAEDFGVAPRFTASQSSTFIRIVGTVGTQYLAATHIFESTTGIQFQLESNVTIGSFGFEYTKVRSIDTGIQTNVPPASITKVNPTPSGHKNVVNEYKADGGRDIEDDKLFRKRIKDGPNILAKHTLAMLEQVFMLINSNVLKVFYHGIDSNGRIVIAIATQNGIDLTQSELDAILDKGAAFFGLSELKPAGSQTSGIVLKNIEYQSIDLSFRCELFPSFDVDEIRQTIQTRISKKLDFRFFDSTTDKIEWDDLLQIVKNTKGVKYVADQYFFPRNDIAVDKTKLPRLRGFRMLNLQGAIIQDFQGNLNPIYYPQQADFSYQQTVLITV